MRNYMLPSVLVLLMALVPSANSQTPVKLTLDDGSLIYCSLTAASLPVDTPYGALVIPLTDIVRVKFGVHHTPAETKILDLSLKALGSDVHREREGAAKILKELGRTAIPSLRKVGGLDREAQKRALQLLADIAEDDPRPVNDFDALTLKRFTIEGSVKAETLAFQSTTLGDFIVPLGKIALLDVAGRHDAMSLVDSASHHGNQETAWMATRLIIQQGDVLTIKASGTVDLFPNTPGQYVAPTPKGYNTVGKGGFLIGALVGKIGATGVPFLIGESLALKAHEYGELHLMIVPSPWNNVSSGQYQVEIKSGK